MTREPSLYRRHRFPGEIISHAVWLYHVFSLSLRDIELILAERGVVVTHESIRHWCRKFGADFAQRLRRRRPRPGDTWHLDEVFIRLNGVLLAGTEQRLSHPQPMFLFGWSGDLTTSAEFSIALPPLDHGVLLAAAGQTLSFSDPGTRAGGIIASKLRDRPWINISDRSDEGFMKELQIGYPSISVSRVDCTLGLLNNFAAAHQLCHETAMGRLPTFSGASGAGAMR